MKQVYLSVIIPCFDEMANLQKGVLEKVKNFLDKEKFVYEVIIADDGSTDGSVAFIKQFTQENPQFHLLQNPHFGKAGAVTTGVLQSKGEYVLFADMDQATPIEEVDKLLPYFEKNYDVVIGSRSIHRKGSPFSRIIMSRAVIILRKFIVGLSDISDTQCGFKMFSHEAAQKIFTKINILHHGFHAVAGSNVTAGFDIELLYLAEQMHFKIKEVPVEWLYVETRRVSPIHDSIEGFLDLLRIKRDAMSGKYSESAI